MSIKSSPELLAGVAILLCQLIIAKKPPKTKKQDEQKTSATV
jgi:hypothetical protein